MCWVSYIEMYNYIEMNEPPSWTLRAWRAHMHSCCTISLNYAFAFRVLNNKKKPWLLHTLVSNWLTDIIWQKAFKEHVIKHWLNMTVRSYSETSMAADTESEAGCWMCAAVVQGPLQRVKHKRALEGSRQPSWREAQRQEKPLRLQPSGAFPRHQPMRMYSV